jgi:type IV pilus assembly protein PilV
MRPRSAAGLSLLEVMIALAILLVGLLGMMHLQVLGITSNNGGRMATVAAQLAEELVSGVERLPFGDPLIDVTDKTGNTAPTPFGQLLDGTDVLAGAHEWDDATPIPGVRLSTAIPPQFERRWTVWGYSPAAGGTPAVKIIAVSIIYREPAIARPREVVLYTQVMDPGTIVSNIPANQ